MAEQVRSWLRVGQANGTHHTKESQTIGKNINVLSTRLCKFKEEINVIIKLCYWLQIT